MGKLDGQFDHEFEDECCVGPSPLIRNNSSPEIENNNESFSNAGEKCSISYMKYRAFRSLNIILFSAKINLLMPCGPAAIVVKCLTGQHVRILIFFFLHGIFTLVMTLYFDSIYLKSLFVLFIFSAGMGFLAKFVRRCTFS